MLEEFTENEIHTTSNEQLANLVYCATPSKQKQYTGKIVRFVISKKKAPIHPFYSFPFKYFENGFFSRGDTMSLCLKLLTICDELWTFGVSHGVIEEVDFAKKQGIRIKHFLLTKSMIKEINSTEFLRKRTTYLEKS